CVALHTPFGPSKTAVPPLTSRRVQPSMVVGLVSGTGAGLAETFVCATADGCVALIACLVSNDSEVWAPRFALLCALMVAVALWFANEPGNVTRSDLAEASGGSAEEVTFLDEERRSFDEKRIQIQSANPSEAKGQR